MDRIRAKFGVAVARIFVLGSAEARRSRPLHEDRKEHLRPFDFDRWEIEVNHRDEKDLQGVGQSQVWPDSAAW